MAITTERPRPDYLANAVKNQMVQDIEAQLRAIAEPEFNRIMRHAAAAAAEKVKVAVEVHEKLYEGKLQLYVSFDGEKLPAEEGR